MAPIDLNLVRAFVLVHDSRSFSIAAEKLGVPRSTVSRAIATLEGVLALRLLHRTTRAVSPTTAGADFYARVSPALFSLDASVQDLKQTSPSGLLRIASTADMGAMVLAEAAARFINRYPDVQVEAHLSTRVVDMVSQGFDLALRVSAKALRSSSLVARRIGALEICLFASPAYVARAGLPRGTADLEQHTWTTFSGAGRLTLRRGHRRVAVKVLPRLSYDDAFFAREAAKAGAGIAPLPTFLAASEVAAGTLVPVLPQWVAHSGGVYIVQPSRRLRPPKVTAFAALLTDMLAQRPLFGV